MDIVKSTPKETFEELCEQARNETDSDKLQQLARKIVCKLGDRKYQKTDHPSAENSETPA